MKLILKRILFYVISFTWGGIMSAIGLLVLLVTLPFGKFGVYHGRIYKRIGKHWGGVELGCFFLCDESAGESTLAHEAGHGLQNCLWGPLMPFVVCIPSATRYWLLEQKVYKEKQHFAKVVAAIAGAVSILLIVFFSLIKFYWGLIIPGIILIYGVVWFYWLWCVEIPQYKERPYPKYDDIWFEGQATRWGKEHVATDKI